MWPGWLARSLSRRPWLARSLPSMLDAPAGARRVKLACASCGRVAAVVDEDPAGKIVVAGTTQAGGGVAVARLNANGSPDATFGAAGKAAVDFGAAASCNAVALQPNGRIVVAGQRTGTGDFAVARLLG